MYQLSDYGLDDRAIEVRPPAEAKIFVLYPPGSHFFMYIKIFLHKIASLVRNVVSS
jgi:hypothetical protein